MREQYTRFKLLNRYSMDLAEFFALSARSPGWRRTLLKMLLRYWLDTGTRRIGARDRRFTSGAALMGPIFKRIFYRGIEVRLETKLEELIATDGKVTGIKVSNFGRKYEIQARHGVVLAAGGFEWNQELRDRFLAVPGLTRHSSTPEDANRGEALLAGLQDRRGDGTHGGGLVDPHHAHAHAAHIELRGNSPGRVRCRPPAQRLRQPQRRAFRR